MTRGGGPGFQQAPGIHQHLQAVEAESHVFCDARGVQAPLCCAEVQQQPHLQPGCHQCWSLLDPQRYAVDRSVGVIQKDVHSHGMSMLCHLHMAIAV